MLSQPIQAVSNLFLCQCCPLCDRATPKTICPSCWQHLQQGALDRPAQPTVNALPILAWGPYQGALKQAIAALKYHPHPQLAVPLGRALGTLWLRHPIATRQPPLVLPIPMHAAKQKQRGFNQAELLARAFCDATGLTLMKNGLVRQRATAPQYGLGVHERQQNLAGAFELGKAWQHRRRQPVLLLDDIYTTGTTVQMAAMVLRRHGISVCGVAAIAQAILDSPTELR
jgi:ComF family protein